MLEQDDSGLTPLFGISRLSSAPAAQVIVTTSEAACKAAQTLFPTCAHVYYSTTVQMVDWGSLAGRSVALMPSSRMEHKQEAEWIGNRLRSIVREVKLIEPESHRPEGWSLDDALADGWDSKRAVSWARERARPMHLEDHQLAAPAPQPELAESNGAPAVRQLKPKAPKPAPPPVPAANNEFEPEAQKAAEKFSEVSLGDMFVRYHQADWRYVHENGKWYDWRGDGWFEDKTNQIRAYATDLVREANSWADVGQLKASMRRSLCSSKTVNAIVSLSGSSREMTMTLDQFDANPWLLGVPGGCVDLETGEFMAARRDDYITMRTSVAPVEGDPVTWLGHLNFVLDGDQEKIGFLRRYLGYMLTGLVRDHSLVFLYGGGGNGKGTIVETFVKMMGDYGYAAPVNLMMESVNDRHPTELAALRGKRAVSCSEPKQGAKWDDGKIRSLTGGDTVTARKMGQDFTSFAPSHKLIIMGNHKPALRVVDEALKRRFNILDFSVTIPKEKRDTAFGEKLMKEAGQILNWAIQGCLEWQKQGLNTPQSMRDATDDYLSGEDVLAQFVEDRFERDPAGAMLCKEVYREFTEWAEMNGEKQIAGNALSRALTEMPGIHRARKYGQRAIAGIVKRRAPDASA